MYQSRNKVNSPITWPRVAATGAAGVLALHFGFTFLHVAPANPVSQQLAPAVGLWMSPFFDQNWELFAPDPVSRDTGLLVRGMTGDESLGGFIDLSTAMLERKLHNPVPDNLHYTVSSASHNLLSARQDLIRDDSVLAAVPEAAESGLFLSEELLEAAPDSLRTAYERTVDAIVQLAINAVRAETGVTPDAVQVRVVTHEFPRWSERADAGVGEVAYSDTPWLTADGEEVIS